jgi:hypothetical protein
MWIRVFKISSDPLECALMIERCISYERSQYKWVCDICEDEYRLDNDMNCNICADGYNSNTEALECIINNPDNIENQHQSSGQAEEEEEG